MKQNREAIEKRIEKLLQQPIRVFYHPSFDDPKQRKEILGEIPDFDKFQQDKEKVRKLQNGKISPELRPCYEEPLLTREQEYHLFRKMNYYKYRAKMLLADVNPRRIGETRLGLVEEYLRKAAAIRNQLASSNFRLATQVLKGQISFYREHSLTDSLLSDAYFDVLKAVDYFDYNLGNKFSTYCTWVLRKNFCRDMKNQIRHYERFQTVDEFAEDIEDRGTGYEQEQQYEEKKATVDRLLDLLRTAPGCGDNKRQAFIIENYFGVKGKEKNTLEGVSKKIGITKERVRQLKEKGIQTIRSRASELGLCAANGSSNGRV